MALRGSIGSGTNVVGRWLRPAAALVALLAAASPARALDPSVALTQYTHRAWQQQEGLPLATIYAIAQDRDGYIWLGMEGRIARFDGRFFTSFDGSPSAPLGASIVRDLAADPDGSLWLASLRRGLLRSAGGTLARVPAGAGLPGDRIDCVLRGPGDALLACTDEGLAERVGDGFVLHGTREGLPAGPVRAACRARSGVVWVAGRDFGPRAWDGKRFDAPARLAPLDKTVVHALLCGEGNDLWIATEDGLFRDDGTRLQSWGEADGLPSAAVLSLARGRGGVVWIGTRDGFARWRDGRMESYPATRGLTHGAVFALFEDDEGTLWVGTKNGLNQFVDARVVPFTSAEGLPSNDAGPVAQAADGTIWVGTLGGGAASFDGRRFHPLTTRDGLPSDRVLALAAIPDGSVWAGTDRGAARIVGRRVVETATSRTGLPGDRVRAIAFDEAEGRLWAGTDRGLAWRPLRGGPWRVEEQVPRAGILALSATKQGRLFATLEDATFVTRREGTFRLHRLKDQSAPPDAFLLDEDRTVWLGSPGGGLRRYRDGATTIYGVQDGLYDDEIFSILPDDRGNLWFASGKGIFRVGRASLERFAAGARNAIVSVPFAAGAARFQCRGGVQPAGLRARDGRFWFPTTTGVVVVDPAHVPRDAAPPRPRIEAVLVNGVPAREEDLAALRPWLRNIEIQFTTIALSDPESARLRYKLEGYDREWRPAGARRAVQYTNLPPGAYRFVVRATGAAGEADAAEASTALRVHPYFYQRPPFIAAAVAVLALATWLVYRWRLRRMAADFRLVLAERGRIARELHDTLLQGLSGVTMQLHALKRRMPEGGAAASLDGIIEDAAACAGEARRSLQELRGERQPAGAMAAKLHALARRVVGQADVELRLRCGQGLPELAPEVEFDLLRIAQEALSNVVRHAGASSVEVDLDERAGGVVLRVADDGRGFDPRAAGAEAHFGLVGMRERAAQIGAKISLASAPGRGAVVEVLVPRRVVRRRSWSRP